MRVLIESWLNRDPLGEPGFELIRNPGRTFAVKTANDYPYVANDPLNSVDPFGLKIFKCVRQAKTMQYNLHAYLWDDKNKKSCGRTGSGWSKKNPAHGEDAGDTGPADPNSNCVEIPNSDGKEDSVMKCCMRTDPNSKFIPGRNDCHNWAGDCLSNNGLTDPPLPRFNDRFWNETSDGLGGLH